ncbi:MAG TPA: hypothetical protein VHG08_14335 [Longimicrobium sp.]|nr:hypothetical protein [Longimicrobium sp.]
MSEVLVDFAAPLLADFTLPEDREAFEGAINLASLLWNVSVCPPRGGHSRRYVDLRRVLGDAPDAELEALFDAVIARGRRLYPGLDRVIAGVELDFYEDGTFRINVASVA